MFGVGCGISPILSGYIWDTTGNYDLALIGASMLFTGTVLLTLTLPKFPQ